MKHEYLNDGEPLPDAHPHAGKIGIVIDYENGSAPQRVYAENDRAMSSKLVEMYGNTKTRLDEVKTELDIVKPKAPVMPPQPTTAENRIQMTAELDDPARSGKAIKALLKEEGIDLDQTKRDQELQRLTTAVKDFEAMHPDYKGGPWGRLIVDRAMSVDGHITKETLSRAFLALAEGGLLPSAAMEQSDDLTQTPHEPSAHEPSAHPQPRPQPVSTGTRPSQFGGGSRRTPPSAPSLTYDQIIEMSGTDAYEDRLRNEPGFQEQVNKVVEAHEKKFIKRVG